MFLAAVLALFLVGAVYQLDLPGLHYDEAKEAGNNAVQLLGGQPVQVFRDTGIRVGGVLLPLMVQDYIGALNVYLAVPFLALFGISVTALRLLPVAIGAATLVWVFLLGRELYGRRAAAIATLLLAVNPSYLFWSRQGVFVTNVSGALAVASTLTAVRWWRERLPRQLYLVAFLWGLGLYAKLLFVWIIGASVGVMLAGIAVRELARGRPASPSHDLGPAPRAPGRLGLRPPEMLGAALAFALPLLPLLLFNVRSGGTMSSILGNLGSSYYGVQNLAFGANLWRRLEQLIVLLRGDHLWYLGARLPNPLAPWIAAGLAIAALGSAGLCRLRGSGSASGAGLYLAPLLFCFLVVVQSSVTISDLFITHYAILLPFLFVAVGGLAACLVTCGGRWILAPLVAALVFWVGADAWNSVRYHWALTATGGHAAHSDATYKLADYLSSCAIVEPLAMDWGIEAPLYFLTEGSVRPLEVFGYERLDAPDGGFGEQVKSFASDRSRVYLFHPPEETVFQGRREEFDRIAREAGLVPTIDAVFHERSGRLVLVVARLEAG